MKHIVSRMLMLTVLTCSVNILFAQEKAGDDKKDKSKTEVNQQDSKDSKHVIGQTKKARSSSDQVSSGSEGKKDNPKSFFGKLFGKSTKSSASAKSTSSGKSAPGSSSAKKGGKTKGKSSDSPPSVGGDEKGEESKDEHRQDKDDGGR